MNRLKKIQIIRDNLRTGQPSIGSWIQIPHASIAEIMGQSGYDWVAVDMEHGAISVQQLPDIFRALELGNTLPLVRLLQGEPKECKQALDAGAGGVIVPMVESAEQVEEIKQAICWPPSGNRGVGFSRANLFGKYFDIYVEEAQQPFLAVMIENMKAVANLDGILSVNGLDAILIGPYDLSASMGLTGQFDNPKFNQVVKEIIEKCNKYKIPCGDHLVEPSLPALKQRVKNGYRFIAYSIDSVFINNSAQRPII
jgi:2-dehydro-3-deoxyglucarate aldolase